MAVYPIISSAHGNIVYLLGLISFSGTEMKMQINLMLNGWHLSSDFRILFVNNLKNEVI